MPINLHLPERKGVGDSVGTMEAFDGFADELKKNSVRPSDFRPENLAIPSNLLRIQDEITDKLGRAGLAEETEEIKALRDADTKIGEAIQALRDATANIL